MLVTDFDYDLPQELIAQHPMEPRDHSRLLVVDKKTGEIEHKHFYDLVNYLKPGDVLVFNDTRVIPARLHGTKLLLKNIWKIRKPENSVIINSSVSMESRN